MTKFDRVYEIVSQIPYGRVTTYGQIARLLGNPRLSRVVGYALHTAPEGLPCHRVVNREGRVSGVFEHGGINEQILLLEEEGAAFIADDQIDLLPLMWYGPEED